MVLFMFLVTCSLFSDQQPMLQVTSCARRCVSWNIFTNQCLKPDPYVIWVTRVTLITLWSIQSQEPVWNRHHLVRLNQLWTASDTDQNKSRNVSVTKSHNKIKLSQIKHLYCDMHCTWNENKTLRLCTKYKTFQTEWISVFWLICVFSSWHL